MNDGRGPPDGLRANPTPLRFLFFGSFFSFPERKERTEHPVSFSERKERTGENSSIRKLEKADVLGVGDVQGGHYGRPARLPQYIAYFP
ncbi:MAG TPA: hypothetical protein IAD24_01485 [Candidatus Aphodomorpha intestinavium]|uniref:Uncharacterized protein n=1 Tax=Candidatus Aphodomorpha intestinavium TaxID=2840672 RepID=A0A9D1ST30_9FIRM|nr:hypothetical protein [Candidatus Aphodomorpha intestinavium]